MLTSPILTGVAPPGAMVALLQVRPGLGDIVVGTGVADANGGYSIKATLTPGIDTVLALQQSGGRDARGRYDLAAFEWFPACGRGHPHRRRPAGQTGPLTSAHDQRHLVCIRSGNDADHAALYVDGVGAFASEAASFTLTADGNPTPIARRRELKLSASPRRRSPTARITLVVTETFLDGETVQSAPTTLVAASPVSRRCKLPRLATSQRAGLYRRIRKS